VTHMVIFRSPEGKPGYHQSEGLDDAMRFAEMLRNQEQVTDARIFRMDEVPIEFKTYYRVEIASAAESGNIASAAENGDIASAAENGDGAGPSEPPAAEESEATEQPVAEPAEDRVEEPVEEPADGVADTESEPGPLAAEAKAAARHGLFSRS
jgi:hypothetical protein